MIFITFSKNTQGLSKGENFNLKLFAGEPKKFTIDTSVLINNEDCLFKFEENEIIIPSVVWEELNDIKDRRNSYVGAIVGKILRVLEELSKVRPLREGVKLKEIPPTSQYYELSKGLETTIRIDYNIRNSEIDKSFTMDKRDYYILSCAKNNDSILVTDDISFVCIARDWDVCHEK